MREPVQPGPRRAGAAKLRRKLMGGLDLDRAVEDQREAFARLLALTEVGMPEHALDVVRIAGLDLTTIEVAEHELQGSDRVDWQILYLHGGGYSLGSPRTHRPLAARLARRCAARVRLPSFSLAPEHACPTALDELLRLWSALPEPERARTVLAGDSAGGGLALALTQLLCERGEPLPRALVLLSPWTDLTLSGASIERHAGEDLLLSRAGLELMAGRYAARLGAEDPRVSPLLGRFEGLPPTLIQVGGREVLLDDSLRVAERARAAGVELALQVWEEQGHVFQATPLLPAASEALDAVAAWLSEALSPFSRGG